nr:MAG TPA: hypothetical protein [Caudoviricetes sp.]
MSSASKAINDISFITFLFRTAKLHYLYILQP